jgi:hypothetical protein
MDDPGAAKKSPKWQKIASHYDDRQADHGPSCRCVPTNRFPETHLSPARGPEIFFKTYTEKVWGMKCSEIGADWAAQRISRLGGATH